MFCGDTQLMRKRESRIYFPGACAPPRHEEVVGEISLQVFVAQLPFLNDPPRTEKCKNAPINCKSVPGKQRVRLWREREARCRFF